MAEALLEGRTPPSVDVPLLELLLGSASFHFSCEDDLQAGIAKLLTSRGIPHEREVLIGRGDRIDFVVERIGLEVKIRASLTDMTRQLHRYAASPALDHLVLVTTSLKLRACLPSMINGKSLSVIVLMGAVL